MADYPLVNGLKYDWSSVVADLGEDAGIHTGVKELTYSETLEPGVVRGTRAEKLALTRGEHDADGTIIMYTEDHAEFIEALGNGYMEKFFDITVSYANEGQPTTTVKLFGCRITSEEGGGSQGTDPLEVSMDLNIMRKTINGISAIANQLK